MIEPSIVGQVFGDPQGNQFRVIAVNNTHVTLDANHELVGKPLFFDKKLASI